jgi:hypothetical protein
MNKKLQATIEKMPQTGFVFNEEAHVYVLDGKPLTGVTTILGVIAKPALIQWSADMACNYVREKTIDIQFGFSIQALETILTEARLAHRKKKESAGTIGTEAHKQIENFIKGKPFDEMTDQVKSMVDQFIAWAKEHNVKFLESEKRLFSKEHWYAGTVDFVAEIDGKVWIGDIKTSSGIYPEYFFQTAGYQLALQENGEYPEIEGHVIVNIKKDGSKFEIEKSYGYQQSVEAFKAALTIYRAQEALKTTL